MDRYIERETAAQGWSDAVRLLCDAPNHEIVNLSVAITQPLAEEHAVHRAFDSFVAARNKRLASTVPPVATVANTIFPASIYCPSRPDAEAHLYQARKRVVERQKRFKKRYETYFDRLIAYPWKPEPINQLERVIGQIRAAKEKGHSNGSLYELALFHAHRDARPQAFPCLSHISLSLVGGTIHMSAVYRNQYFLQRAYGNYVGLGRLLNFIACETGFECGELLCVSSHAKLDCSQADADALLAECAHAMEQGN